MKAPTYRSWIQRKLVVAVVLSGALLSLAPLNITINGVADVDGNGTPGDDVTGSINSGMFPGATTNNRR